MIEISGIAGKSIVLDSRQLILVVKYPTDYTA